MMTPQQTCEDIEATIDRAYALGDPGQMDAMYLVGTEKFLTGDNSNITIAMDVPRDADFYGQSLALYLGARLLDQANKQGTSTELTYRPANWVTTPNQYGNDGYSAVVPAANAVWLLSDTYNGAYQGGAGLEIAAAYSHRWGQGTVLHEVQMTAWQGARYFHVPYKVRRGHSITIALTPTFSRVVAATIKTEFRVTAVFTGYKIIRAAT